MLSSRKKLQLASAFATLLLFAVIVGCNGFFVNPTLTGITVGPAATINTGSTVQMTAVGTYNDGSTNTLGSGVNWSSGTTSVATVNNAGLVTGVSSGTSSITGSFQTQTNSATITVQLSNITKITVTSGSPPVTSIPQGETQQFDAMATTSSGTQDITDSASWASSNTAAGTIDANGLFTAATGLTSNQTTTITATEDGVTGQETFTVTTQ
jgi:hypothetical protein